ncbi:glucose-6-phosphate isomerase family protein [Raoultella terrigena]|uniref:glucose-6-phosphate isomerase family protein n=1 Tax=Raoultella terrigena TaxID=577 RepID=UPI001F52A567|nr:glucose-6-phosphate isomerase family protein [Raoultella terrigena]MCI1032603.1 glucose-6-phosphate isomerase [Raoultella terrigena]
MANSARAWGLDMTIHQRPLGFGYGNDVTGPMPEIRRLDQIRASLRDPHCEGPDEVYAIAMDVARMQDRDELKKRMLLFGVVTYAAGRLGEEPVRSQGHIHRISQHSGWSPPELYEIWQGKAIIYMQERVEDDPGRCFAVIAEPGDKVLVPPGWGHATISADPEVPLTFGAWCDREYGFEYDAVRAYKGLAWYPLLQDNHVVWQHNSRYLPGRLQAITPRRYVEFDLTSAPIYQQFIDDPARLQFISSPDRTADLWHNFHP